MSNFGIANFLPLPARHIRVSILQGDRKSRIAFAEKMREKAFSFPKDDLEELAALVLTAARARNGWRVIREATVIHPIRRRSRTTAARTI